MILRKILIGSLMNVSSTEADQTLFRAGAYISEDRRKSSLAIRDVECRLPLDIDISIKFVVATFK